MNSRGQSVDEWLRHVLAGYGGRETESRVSAGGDRTL